jgi:5'-methylthioadenosine phosphorylase
MRIAIIGGSGIEDRLSAAGLLEEPQLHEIQTPFGRPSAPIITGHLPGSHVPIAALKRHGHGHTIPPHRVPSRANIFALKTLGVTHIIATGAVGSLREHIRPGDIVLCDQLIDRTTGAGTRAQERTFFDSAAVHVEFADPCCPIMREWLSLAAKNPDPPGAPSHSTVHPTGSYITIDGPSFSTRAESHMHRAIGADVVGMTALPEARLAREAEIAYARIALPTDYDCWKDTHAGAPPESILNDIIANLDRSAAATVRVIAAALRDTTPLLQPSPAHDALKLAIWTRREVIAPAEIERLRPIWGRWFE